MAPCSSRSARRGAAEHLRRPAESSASSSSSRSSGPRTSASQTPRLASKYGSKLSASRPWNQSRRARAETEERCKHRASRRGRSSPADDPSRPAGSSSRRERLDAGEEEPGWLLRHKDVVLDPRASPARRGDAGAEPAALIERMHAVVAGMHQRRPGGARRREPGRARGRNGVSADPADGAHPDLGLLGLVAVGGPREPRRGAAYPTRRAPAAAIRRTHGVGGVEADRLQGLGLAGGRVRRAPSISSAKTSSATSTAFVPATWTVACAAWARRRRARIDGAPGGGPGAAMPSIMRARPPVRAGARASRAKSPRTVSAP